jgi:hypothetical protein
MENPSPRRLRRLIRMFLIIKRQPSEVEGEESPTRGDYLYEKTIS